MFGQSQLSFFFMKSRLKHQKSGDMEVSEVMVPPRSSSKCSMEVFLKKETIPYKGVPPLVSPRIREDGQELNSVAPKEAG